MNCPKCGNEMSPGWMIPGKICHLEWAPERGQFPFPRKGRVRLKPTPPPNTPFDFVEYPAYLCAACKTVIFEYQ
jgi:hypothetical protein